MLEQDNTFQLIDMLINPYPLLNEYVLKLRREATLSSSWSYMVDVKFDSILFQLRRIESHYFGAKLEDIEAKCSGL